MESDLKTFKTKLKRRLYNIALDTIKFIDKLDQRDLAVRKLSDQLLRSSTSIIGNYIEGESATSDKELIKYLNIALRSSNETKLWLCMLKDSGRAKKEQIETTLNELNEISKILATSIISLKKKLNTSKIKKTIN